MVIEAIVFYYPKYYVSTRTINNDDFAIFRVFYYKFGSFEYDILFYAIFYYNAIELIARLFNRFFVKTGE